MLVTLAVRVAVRVAMRMAVVVVMMPWLGGGTAAMIAHGQVTSMEISSSSRPRRTSWLRVWQTGQR